MGSYSRLWEVDDFLKQCEVTVSPKINLKAKQIGWCNMLAQGSPGVLSAVLPLLKDRDFRIREHAFEALVEFFQQIKSKGYYSTMLQYIEISKLDIYNYKETLPERVYIILLCIASFNRNGYLREYAVMKLAETRDQSAIPFIVYRLGDWVEEIRQTARNAINVFMRIEYIDSLLSASIDTDPFIKVRRTDLRPIYQELLDFIFVQCRSYVINNFSAFDDKRRLFAAEHLCDSGNLCLSQVRLMLTDRSFLIRSKALRYFENLEEKDIRSLIQDKSAKIRINVLSRLKGRPGFRMIAANYVADISPAVRAISREAMGPIDFARIYEENLQRKLELPGSLMGLADIRAGQCAPNVEVFLYHESKKVRYYAFLALLKLDMNTAYQYALSNLNTKYARLRMVIVAFLSKNPAPEVLSRAREIIRTDDIDMKKTMFKMLSKIGKWAVLGDLILGAVDQHPEIREVCVGHLVQWKSRMLRCFIDPTADELKRAKDALEYVRGMQKMQGYVDWNFFAELDFCTRS